MQSVPSQVKFARELYSKVKAEFPEVSRDLDSTQLELTKHKLGTPRFNEEPTGKSISRSERTSEANCTCRPSPSGID